MFQNPYELLNYMKKLNIQYGWYDRVNKLIIKPDHPNWNSDYFMTHCNVLSPAEVELHKVGTCWDCSLYEWYHLKTFGLDPHMYFIDDTNYENNVQDHVNHTAIYYEYPNLGWYWFEYAWYDQRGLHGPYDTKDDVLNVIFSQMVHMVSLTSDIFVNEDVNVARILVDDPINMDIFFKTLYKKED